MKINNSLQIHRKLSHSVVTRKSVQVRTPDWWKRDSLIDTMYFGSQSLITGYEKHAATPLGTKAVFDLCSLVLFTNKKRLLYNIYIPDPARAKMCLSNALFRRWSFAKFAVEKQFYDLTDESKEKTKKQKRNIKHRVTKSLASLLSSDSLGNDVCQSS